MISKDQTEKKLKTVKLGFPYQKATLSSQGINVAGIKYKIDFFR